MGSTSLVSLVVELVENFAQHVADVADVGFVVVFAYVVMWHVAHVAVQPVNSDVDAVERPPAEEPGNGHGEVEEHLVVHHGTKLFCMVCAGANWFGCFKDSASCFLYCLPRANSAAV